MNILVVGCGTLGAALCKALSERGHDVSVVSDKKDQFGNLPADFSGYTTLGVPIDREVLKKAGIENCEALAAVTADDNTNLMAAQLAKEFFHVPRAFARVGDPGKNSVYGEFGLDTICPTNTAVSAFCAALCGGDSMGVTVGGHTIVTEIMELPREFIGKKVSEIEFDENETLVAIEHADGAVARVLLNDPEFERGDRMILARFAD